MGVPKETIRRRLFEGVAHTIFFGVAHTILVRASMNGKVAFYDTWVFPFNGQCWEYPRTPIRSPETPGLGGVGTRRPEADKWQDRSARGNGAQLYGPRVSDFLSHRIVKSSISMIDGKLEFQCTRNGPQNPPFCPGSPQNTFISFLRYLKTIFSQFSFP